MRRLFLFRPEPGASRSAERARALGLQPVVVPLFRIERVQWKAPPSTEFDALLLTSANAVRCAGDQLGALRGLPVHAVGETTALAAREAGLDVATVGDGGVERLLGALEPQLRLLHLGAEERREIGNPQQAITVVPVYRARPLPRPPALGALRGEVGAVHSPRAAARLCQLVDDQDRRTVRLAAISGVAADAAGAGWERVEAAAAPNDAALLACAARLCEKPEQE